MTETDKSEPIDAPLKMPSTMPEGWAEVLDQIHRRHADGHKRLRDTITELSETVESNFEYLNNGHVALKLRVNVMAKAPIDATKLVLTLPVVITILIAALAVAGTVYGTSSGLKTQMADMSTKIDSLKQRADANTQLQDERAARLTRDVADIKAQQTMQDLKITNLRETVLKATR